MLSKSTLNTNHSMITCGNNKNDYRYQEKYESYAVIFAATYEAEKFTSDIWIFDRGTGLLKLWG
jgi:hypothetical protein